MPKLTALRARHLHARLQEFLRPETAHGYYFDLWLLHALEARYLANDPDWSDRRIRS